MKRIITTFILIVFLLLTGSDNNKYISTSKSHSYKGEVAASEDIPSITVSGAESVDSKELKLVRKPDKAAYILRNGLKEDYLNKTINTEKEEVKIDICQISGLSDKSVEEKINTSIEAAVEREIKEYAKEADEKSLYNLATRIMLDANNLLSVSVLQYRAEDSFQLYGMLFSLTDGKRLYLKDIFTEGTTYIPLINQKVTESLIGGNTPEENVLREPFSSIKDNQNFVITQSDLHIIFKKGDSGFSDRTSIRIPLCSIDDYVDVIDRYETVKREKDEFDDLVVKMNNIFIDNKTDSVKKNKSTIFIQYPEISGTRDPKFEKLINSIINDDTYNMVKNIKIKNTDKSQPDNDPMPSGSVFMNVALNHYGILTIERRIYYPGSDNIDNLFKVYSFDLRMKRAIDTKEILNNYIKLHPDAESIFVSTVKSKLLQLCRERGLILPPELENKFDYSFIRDHSIIYFTKHLDRDWTYINIVFDKKLIQGIPEAIECSLLYKDVIKDSPEDFFGQ